MRTTASIKRLARDLLPIVDRLATAWREAIDSGEPRATEIASSLAAVIPKAAEHDDAKPVVSHEKCDTSSIAKKLATITLLARLQWHADSDDLSLSALKWLARSTDRWLAAIVRDVAKLMAYEQEQPASEPADHREEPIHSIASTAREIAAWSASISDDERPHLWELLHSEWSPADRKQRGVFFTPERLAHAMVERVDQLLRDEFDLTEGLADTTTWDAYSPGNARGFTGSVVRICDPAAGSGAFLLAAIERIHQTISRRENSSLHAWSSYVDKHLLPRIIAVELLPEATAVMALRITQLLLKTGYDFVIPAQLMLQTGNALAGPMAQDDSTTNHLHSQPITVILGNPPFASLSQNRGEWITGLVRDYLTIDGERLGERKTWLHDDYVKFLRLSQWRIEQTGLGIVALVTNHSWLDNTTFRIARRRLHATFPRIEIADFHGNRKSGEVAPNVLISRENAKETAKAALPENENIFALDAGIAASFLRSREGFEAAITRADFWGTKDAKIEGFEQQVAQRIDGVKLSPNVPEYRFDLPREVNRASIYPQTPALPQVMPLTSTAVVTARDGLVIAMDRAELMARIEQLVDPKIDDDHLRHTLFAAPRTPRYPAGDTRSFKLTAVREHLRCEREAGVDLASYVRRCAYRPFDSRYIFWHPLLVDWPRGELMQHVIDRENLLLVSRRQMLPGRAANFFWVTDAITLDGILRSDNRGSESLFPLWRYEANSHTRSANISLEIRRKIERSLGDVADGDLLAMMVATFFSSEYRSLYCESLWREFPRVLVPRSRELAGELVALGQQLIDAQLLRGMELPEVPSVAAETVVEARYPKWRDGEVLVNAELSIASCSREVFAYRAGAHAPAEKWLADRRGRKLSATDLEHYQRVLIAIGRIVSTTEQIDGAVKLAGGMEQGFR